MYLTRGMSGWRRQKQQEPGRSNSKHNQLDAQLVLNTFKLALLGPERGEGWFQKFLLLPGFETFHRVSQTLPLTKVCRCSVAKSCLTLCNPMDCSMSAFPVHQQLLELTQTHVHRVGDAIQPSHPLSSPSPPAFNLSQHQGLSQ